MVISVYWTGYPTTSVSLLILGRGRKSYFPEDTKRKESGRLRTNTPFARIRDSIELKPLLRRGHQLTSRSTPNYPQKTRITGKQDLSLSYIPSYVHVRPGYREKSANLQGTLKPNLRFYNRFLRLQTPRNEN